MIYLSKNIVFHEITKYIDVRFHFIKDKICKGLLKIEKVATSGNLSNMMTKAVEKGKFKHCLKLLNIEVTQVQGMIESKGFR